MRVVIIRFTLFILFLILLGYFNASIYDFPEPVPFQGKNIYNPYQGLDENNWQIGNFHAHGNAWRGLANGIGSNQDLYHTYLKRLGYDMLGISNYQKIDHQADRSTQIRTYEHGYSPVKNHQIIIGAEDVCWMEYPLFQSRHHKQHILKILRKNDAGKSMIAIAHPDRGGAYSMEDMKYLTDYDCVEAFNHLCTSVEHWDAALSAGNPVYLLADDDTHNHEHLWGTARHLTMVHNPLKTEENVVTSLKNGQSYAVEVKIEFNETHSILKKKVQSLKRLQKVEVEGNQLKVQFSDTCSSIVFIGQNGTIKKTVKNDAVATYDFQPNDTYIRTMATTLHDEHIYSLNPVFRIEGTSPVKKMATENWPKTVLYRIIIAFCMLIVGSVFVRYEKKRMNRPKTLSGGPSV